MSNILILSYLNCASHELLQPWMQEEKQVWSEIQVGQQICNFLERESGKVFLSSMPSDKERSTLLSILKPSCVLELQYATGYEGVCLGDVFIPHYYLKESHDSDGDSYANTYSCANGGLFQTCKNSCFTGMSAFQEWQQCCKKQFTMSEALERYTRHNLFNHKPGLEPKSFVCTKTPSFTFRNPDYVFYALVPDDPIPIGVDHIRMYVIDHVHCSGAYSKGTSPDETTKNQIRCWGVRNIASYLYMLLNYVSKPIPMYQG